MALGLWSWVLKVESRPGVRFFFDSKTQSNVCKGKVKCKALEGHGRFSHQPF